MGAKIFAHIMQNILHIPAADPLRGGKVWTEEAAERGYFVMYLQKNIISGRKVCLKT